MAAEPVSWTCRTAPIRDDARVDVRYWRPVSEALQLLGATLFGPARRYLEQVSDNSRGR